MKSTAVGFHLKESVRHYGIPTDAIDFECLLRQCGDANDLLLGRYLHTHIIKVGHETNGFLANLLLQMYGKCQAVDDADRLFVFMRHKDQYSWTFMIGAYAQLGRSKDALHVYQQMQRNDMMPNVHTYIYLLSGCVNKEALSEGRHVHTFILCSGCEQKESLATALVCMYGKCGSVDDAFQVFNSMCEKDSISWNAIIYMASELNYAKESRKLFQQMQVEGFLPTKGTFLSLCNGYQDQSIVSRIKRLHTLAVGCGYHTDVAVVNAFVTMYGKCGSVSDANMAFQAMPLQNVISWTAMITAYAERGQSTDVVRVFQRMLSEGFTPDKVTFASSLASCVNKTSLFDGLWLHSCICNSGFESDVIVGTALVTMYGRCGSVKDARRTFEKLPERDLVCWNAIIAMYAQNEHGKEALNLLRNMGMANFVPNKLTFISILDACARETALEDGSKLHACLMQYDFESETVVMNALVNFYGKCGSLTDSQRLFDKLSKKSLVSWAAIIAAYGQQGCGTEALFLLEQMRKERVTPNEVTFVSVISSCSHAGLVEEAYGCVLFMQELIGITSTMEHFHCLVDLLGRAGLLSHGQVVISNIPYQPSANTWMTFLGSCSVHCNDMLAKYCTLHALEVDSTFAAPYVLFSNICGAIGEEMDDTVGEDLREEWEYNFAEAL